jgi:hypothetical protein
LSSHRSHYETHSTQQTHDRLITSHRSHYETPSTQQTHDRLITSHRIASHRIASHRIASHHMTLHYIASHRIASHQVATLRCCRRRQTRWERSLLSSEQVNKQALRASLEVIAEISDAYEVMCATHGAFATFYLGSPSHNHIKCLPTTIAYVLKAPTTTCTSLQLCTRAMHNLPLQSHYRHCTVQVQSL